MPADNLVFSVQCGFSFTVLLFCIAMLAANKDPTYYLPILTSIIGYWLPAPRGTATANGGALRSLPNLWLRRQNPVPEDPPDVEMGTVSEGVVGPQPPPASPASPPPPPPRYSLDNSLATRHASGQLARNFSEGTV